MKIAPDIMEKATKLVNEDLGLNIPGGLQNAFIGVVADALQAIRDECASLVESVEIELQAYPSEEAAHYYQAGAIDACISAASAIRALQAKEGE